jgi:N-acetylglucosaminyl-diphospho-decaprenol L-rhamnosyltransferase
VHTSTLSVVIPSWNRAELVEAALRHLLEQGMPAWGEVIVVDDASTDDTATRTRTRFPSVHVIRRDKNGGFGAAVNTGFQAARGDYLATVNNDALVTWPSLERLVAFLERTPGAAAAAPGIRNAQGTWQPTGFSFPRGPAGWARRWTAGRHSPGTTPSTEPERADYLRGACLVFRRQALEQVGLFDEQFFMFAEELDLFRRLAARGWSAWVVRDAVAEHIGGKSSRGHEDRAISSRFRRMSYRSMSVYYRKHHAWPWAVLLRGILAARVSGRLLRSVLLSVGRPEERWWVREHAGCLLNVVRPCSSVPLEPRLAPRAAAPHDLQG